ncbi:MAG TPA: DUF5916 domain-containing protein [Gemmatimonadota bacterium]
MIPRTAEVARSLALAAIVSLAGRPLAAQEVDRTALLATTSPSAFPALPSFVVADTLEAGRAGAGPAAFPLPEGKRIETARATGATPRVDGRLDDAAWSAARFVTDFQQKEPEQGAAPTEKTEVAFLYDDRALYVAARMHVSNARALDRILTRRDDDPKAERLVVTLDTYHDRRTAYGFAVTASGARLDWYHPEDDQARTDMTYNPVWEAHTAVDGDAWTAEMRIPFSQLRFTGAGPQTWGVNVERIVPSRNEQDYWVYVPRGETGWVSRFGELVGIQGLPAGRRLEVMPYVAGSAHMKSDALVEDDNPLDDGRDTGASTGMDLKMGLGSNLTLDGTVNPDFGQIEADPAQVNLSAFEVFFDEKRPFFTEGGQFLGAQLYADGQPNDPPPYFYSRRIGGPPHGVAEADFVDAPTHTSILGAAKVTGQLESGLSVGGLAAVTAEEQAHTYDVASRRRDDVAVEPRTYFGVTRLQKQFGAAGSTVALMLTGVRRDLPEGALADSLTRDAITGGADWNLRFAGGEYDLKGHLGFSYVDGDSAAIERVQRSSAHYFQRPDQDHVHLDPSRTSLFGVTGSMRFRKTGGGHLRAEAGAWGDGPGLELNDLGRVANVDDIATWSTFKWQEDTPRGLLRNWNASVNSFVKFNFGGTRKLTRGFLRSEHTWSNFWESSVELGLAPEWLDPDATRGGPMMGRASGWDLTAALSGNPENRLKWSADGYAFANAFGAWGVFLNAELASYVGDRLRLSVAPHWSHSLPARQYVDALAGGPPATFGTRYIFAAIDQHELSAQLRANYSFTPDLSLEVYAEPFASSGRYSRFGELPEPGSRTLKFYGSDGTTLARDAEGNVLVTDGAQSFTLDNPDFNVLSYRSNVVLRWEWQPGSTLYLVWQQNRSAAEAIGDPVGMGSLLDARTEPGENVLALKVTYWLPVR